MTPVRMLCSLPGLNGGGAERVMLHLCRYLPAAGFEITLLLGRRLGQFASSIPEGVDVVEIGSERAYNAVPAMRSLLASNRFDVSFSMLSFNLTASMAAALCPASRTKVVLGARNHYSSALQREASRPALRKLAVRALYPRADLIIAVAEDARRDLIDQFGIPAERVTTIHNPVDIDAVRERAAATSPDPWLEGDVPVLVNAGKLMEAKGHLCLLEAFRRVLGEHDARLIILGVGPLDAELRAAAREKGIDDRVRFAGFQANPFAFMSRATAFVLSSLWEGFPNVLVEAMASGAPVVSTDCPSGPSEILRDGDSGLLVPVNDPQALAAAMKRVIVDASLRARLRRGAEVELARFSHRAVVARYAATLRELAER